MKKIRRVLAMLGVLLILALYVITIVLAFVGNAHTLPLLKASLIATVVVPVLIWTYTFIYNLLKKYYGPDSQNNDSKKH